MLALSLRFATNQPTNNPAISPHPPHGYCPGTHHLCQSGNISQSTHSTMWSMLQLERPSYRGMCILCVHIHFRWRESIKTRLTTLCLRFCPKGSHHVWVCLEHIYVCKNHPLPSDCIFFSDRRGGRGVSPRLVRRRRRWAGLGPSRIPRVQ